MMWRRRFEALTTTVEITASACDVVASLNATTGTYPVSEREPALRYAVERGHRGYRITRNAEVMDDGATAMDVPAIVELDLFKRCVRRAADFAVLHAAAISMNDSALVMVGESGAGKTTLARQLIEEGAEYLSDECVAIGKDGVVFGLGRPLCVDSRPALSASRLEVHEYPWMDENAETHASFLLHPPPTRTERTRHLGSVVVISHKPDCSPARVSLSSGEALQRVWPNVLNPSEISLEILVSVLRGRTVNAIQSDSVQAGCSLVREGFAPSRASDHAAKG